MEVLNKEIKPIDGLYAAGTICSGWFSGMMLGATPMGFSLFSGYAAGKNAAAYAKSSGK
jgi:succinate dehydrogenase/fumarate reductase flavoprotein subunit